MKQMIERYMKAKGIQVPENDNRGPAAYNVPIITLIYFLT